MQTLAQPQHTSLTLWVPDASGRLKYPLASRRFLLSYAAQNGGRSSMVELQVVVLAVAGSSPVDHPILTFRPPSAIPPPRPDALQRGSIFVCTRCNEPA